MRPSTISIVAGLISASSVHAWGSLGHITVAYIASNFVREDTASYFQDLLRNDTEHYLAGVATWADSIRYMKWAKFTKNFHFIDAKDLPPTNCSVNFERDCKEDGCVVSSIQNYTSQLFDPSLPDWRRAQAAKFVIHFIGDIHQPLHVENVAQGGNGIHVKFDGHNFNLHHVWDTSIAEKLVGDMSGGPFETAQRWATNLTTEIKTGKYTQASGTWVENVDLDDPIKTSMSWANQSNAYVCTAVLPDGPAHIVDQELGSKYFEKAAPVIEIQVARGGYRLATWLDLIVKQIKSADSDEL